MLQEYQLSFPGLVVNDILTFHGVPFILSECLTLAGHVLSRDHRLCHRLFTGQKCTIFFPAPSVEVCDQLVACLSDTGKYNIDVASIAADVHRSLNGRGAVLHNRLLQLAWSCY